MTKYKFSKGTRIKGGSPQKIGEELDKATGMVEGLVVENTRFRHAAAETADLLMREAIGDKP